MLQGVKVLSFTHYLQGPSAAQILADLGADVVKVESTKGAYERSWSGCNTYKNGVSVFFLLGNRNQRAIAVDLKSGEGKQIIYRLVKEYDVILENFRPGVMEKLGLGYETLKKINPRLIYCSCSGYGSSGPKVKKPGQDLLIQSMSGIAALTGNGENPPTPIGTAAVDQHWQDREIILPCLQGQRWWINTGLYWQPWALPLPCMTVIRPGRDTALRQACWAPRWICNWNPLPII